MKPPSLRIRFVFGLAATLVTALITGAMARGQFSSWTGAVNTDWNTAGNWNPSGVPNSFTGSAVFSGSGLGTVNISSSVVLQSFLFSNPTGNYTLTSSAGQVLLPGNSGLVLAVGPTVSGTDTINLSSATSGSLVLNGTISNNSTAGGTLVIGPNTVIGANSAGTGGLTFAGPGSTVISGGFASSINQVTAGLTVSGPGSLTFSGSGTTLLGGLNLNGGTLTLNYSSNTATKFASGSLTLGGGSLILIPKSGTPITQTIPQGTVVSAGHTDVTGISGGTIALDAGSITRTGAGTVDFNFSSPTFAVNTSANVLNGLLGNGPAFATVGGTTWATASGGAITGLATYGTNTYTANTNVDVTASSSQTNVTVNSLRFNTPNLTLTLTGTNTVQSGGILVTPSSGSGATITGGTLSATGGGELIFHQYSNIGPTSSTLTINSAIVSSAGLTKTGGSILTLGGNNTGLTGPINLQRGSLTVTSLAAINSASAINFNDARYSSGLQTFTVDLGNNINGTIAPQISIAPTTNSTTAGATVFSTGASLNSRVTLGQFVDKSYPVNGAAIQFTGDALNTSGFNLVNANAFNNSLLLSHGFLGISSDAALGTGAPQILYLGVGSATSGGLECLQNLTLNHSITINNTSRVVTDPGVVVNIPTFLNSAGSGSAFQFVKAGAGTLTLSGTGSGQNGGLTLSGGTLVLDYSNLTTSKMGSGALTLNGGVLSLTANSATAVTQSVSGGTAVNSGHTDVTATGTGTITLGAGAITHSVGGTVDFFFPVSSPLFRATTTTSTINSLLGVGPAFATVNGGASWATVDQSNFVNSLGAYNTGSGRYGAGHNVDVAGGGDVPAGDFTSNSLRFNLSAPNPQSLSMSGTLTLQSGGVLVTPSSSGGIISGGTLTASNSGELFFHLYKPLSVSSVLVSSTGLTKTGPSDLTLSGTNTGLTGPINVNRGNLVVTNLAAVNSASQINFNDASSFQQLNIGASSGTINSPIRLADPAGNGTQFFNSGPAGSVITLAGGISSGTGLPTPIQFGTNGNFGNGFNLTAANTWAGNVSLSNGSLGINSDAALGNAGNTLTLGVNNLTDGGLVFLNGGIGVARPVLINLPTPLISNGTDSNTISGPISGAGGVFKFGTGSLALTNPGNTVTGALIGGAVVSQGTLSMGSVGQLPAGTSLTVNTTATFIPPTGAGATYGSLTLNDGTFLVSAGTPQTYSVTSISTNSAGGGVNFSVASVADTLQLTGPGASIAINGNSTWLAPGNATTIVNVTGAVIPISVAPGVTFDNALALASNSAAGYLVTGGGTLFQDCNSIAAAAITAPLTVASGSRIHIEDFNVIANLGTGAFTLDGGTFEFAGTLGASTSKHIALTANGGTIQVAAATQLNANGPITGPGPLTKTGPGTLVLGNAGNSFTGLFVNAGMVQAATDNILGGGAVTVAGAGTLSYTGPATTARTFNLNFGTLTTPAGNTVTLAGATVNGGFIVGPGSFTLTGGTSLNGVTTTPSAVLNQTGTASLVNLTNGGSLTVAPGLAAPADFVRVTNQGSGAITIGAVSSVNAAEFQTYGTLTISPAPVTQNFSQTTLMINTGPTPLYFNGGSRTFIGTPATAVFPSGPNAGQPTFVAGIDLNGKNAVVAGGLFVNNGYIEDSSNGFGGTATVIADFGSLVKGAGFFQNSVVTQNGGKFQAGNSPGVASFGKFVLGPGGVSNYLFAINDATGIAGPHPDAEGHVSGWSLVRVIAPAVVPKGQDLHGDFTWTATLADKLTISLETLLNPTTVGIDVPGPMDHFDPSLPYVWPAVEWMGSYTGPADAAMLTASTAFDRTGIANRVEGVFAWSLDQAGQTLALTYTPTAVPEPGSLGLTALAGLASGWFGRCRRAAGGKKPVKAAHQGRTIDGHSCA
jgi:autotransporter-associated beta strand protein